MLVVLIKPPPPVAAHHVLGSSSLIAKSVIRPPILAGPIPRHRIPFNQSCEISPFQGVSTFGGGEASLEAEVLVASEAAGCFID